MGHGKRRRFRKQSQGTFARTVWVLGVVQPSFPMLFCQYLVSKLPAALLRVVP